jgi:prepilin-type N-terminal cleavage/methylation domain-containing protein
MTRARSKPGFTLIELLAALVITTILLAATLSTVMLAGKAVPDPHDVASSSLSAAQVTDQIAVELETATLVLEQTPTAITIVVPPRNNDTTPERIRYSWTGVAGAPLLRQYNRGTAATVLDQVYALAATPTVSTSTETYPGVGTEDASDSLVINDVSAATGLGDSNVTSPNAMGQYFAPPTFASDVVAWRPTRVSFLAKQSYLLGVTNVATVLPDANFLPNGTVLDQFTLAAVGLGGSYAAQLFSLTQSGRLLTTSGFCLTLTCSVGLPASVTVQNNPNAGLLQTNVAGGTWAYQGNAQLQAQLYAKMTHAGTSQTMVSKYLGALALSLRAGKSTNLAVQSSGQALNHPEILSAYWEAKFDKDPTALDVNADGTLDWIVHNGGTFNTASLSNQAWQANGSGLDTQPADNFARLTVIDVRCRGTSTGSWAGVSVNAARSGSTCAPVGAKVTLQPDGTQTATVWRKLSDSTTDMLVTAPGLPASAVDLHLIIDPAHGSVGISVNGRQCGTYAYNSYSSSDSSKAVSLTSSGSAEFSYARVREVAP